MQIKMFLLKHSNQSNKRAFEFCEIFKNTFFTEHFQETASESSARVRLLLHIAPRIHYSIQDMKITEIYYFQKVWIWGNKEQNICSKQNAYFFHNKVLGQVLLRHLLIFN